MRALLARAKWSGRVTLLPRAGFLGLLYVFGKLPTYPSPKPTLTLTSHFGYSGCQRLFMRGFRFRSSLKKSAPRRTREKISGTQGTLWAKCWLRGGEGGQFPRNVSLCKQPYVNGSKLTGKAATCHVHNTCTQTFCSFSQSCRRCTIVFANTR